MSKVLNPSLELVSAPANEPLTLIQAKQHPPINLPLTVTKFDDTLTELIKSARDQLETDTQRALINQSWLLSLPEFPAATFPIYLRKPPVQSITKIDYIDESGMSQTIDAGKYSLDLGNEPGRIWPAKDYIWPATQDTYNAVQVTFEAGYGATAEAMPGIVQHALKLLVTLQFSETEAGEYERKAYDALVNRLGWGRYP